MQHHSHTFVFVRRDSAVGASSSVQTRLVFPFPLKFRDASTPRATVLSRRVTSASLSRRLFGMAAFCKRTSTWSRCHSFRSTWLLLSSAAERRLSSVARSKSGLLQFQNDPFSSTHLLAMRPSCIDMICSHTVIHGSQLHLRTDNNSSMQCRFVVWAKNVVQIRAQR